MSPPYAILRVQKLKHPASVRRSLKHSFREQDTPNADPAKAIQNDHIGATSADQAMARVEALLPEKRRKDAVLAIEYLITASPEAMQGKTREEQDAYFRDSLQWLKDRHGAQNIVYAGIHRDELTPHMYAYAVPIDEASGRLNAKKWLGGAKALANMQTEFANVVGSGHGLERGIEGSKAKHQRVKTFYAAIEKPAQHFAISEESTKPKVLKKGLIRNEYETHEAVAKRLTTAMQTAYNPAIEAAKLARLDRRRLLETAQTAATLGIEKKEAQEITQALQQYLAPVLELAKLARPDFEHLMVRTAERVQSIKAARERAWDKEQDMGHTL